MLRMSRAPVYMFLATLLVFGGLTLAPFHAFIVEPQPGNPNVSLGVIAASVVRLAVSSPIVVIVVITAIFVFSGRLYPQRKWGFAL